MKFLIWIMMLFAAAVALSTAAHNPGYVLLVYQPYRIELSLTLFVLLLLFTFVSGYLLVRMVFAALRLPSFVREFRLERSRNKARELLDESLGALFSARYAEAEQAAAQGMELDEPSDLFAVIAARCAHEQREYEKRDAYLSAVEGNSTRSVSMRQIAQAKFMLDQRDPQAALQALRELRAGGVRDYPGALALELKAQQRAGSWDDVLEVLAQLEKRKAVDVTLAEQLRQKAWLEKIRQQSDIAGLNQCLDNMPAAYRRRSRIAAAAAQGLIRNGDCLAAQQLLSESLNAHWDSELVRLFGDCRSAVLAQIEQAENWLRQHKDDAGLLLALGKLCLHQKLWGKAQSYLDASISVEPSPDAYTALAELAERLGQPEQAFRYYHSAAELK